jgi:glutathione S-transferase
MSLALYGHPFSSYTQKVLIALYENGTPFEFCSLGPDTPEHSAEWLRRWPLRKFPLLVDGERNVVETSIIIEYLQLEHPGPVRLLPADSMPALDVRFLDRFFDLHVMTPVQHAVGAALTGDPVKRQEGLTLAVERLELAYAWLEGHLAARTWAAGREFTMADCAAAPSLFYADWT